MSETTANTSDARHLTLQTLDRFWAAGVPMEMPIVGSPRCRLRLDPANDQLTLVTEYATPEPDVSRLKNVLFRGVAASSEDVAELVVQVRGGLHGAYGLLATVADELQLSGAPLAAAVANGVAKHRNLLAARGGLTTEKEIGLFGELCVVEFLAVHVGPGSAVEAWAGPLSEEHDFVLAGLHLEVKATVSERRRHMISGLTQMVPIRGVPLYLLSQQLTRSVPGAGRTLPELVASVRSAVGGHVVALDERLAAVGWDIEHADLYRTVWTPRNAPRAYLVDEQFPAITPAALESVVPRVELVSEIAYRVDVTDLDFDALGAPMNGFVETPGGHR